MFLCFRLDKTNLLERERCVHDLEQEVCTIRRDLEKECKLRCQLQTELRRAQDELANRNTEIKCMRTELEQRCREAEDLRRQLQEYVHEVRRAEDLLGEKERERKQLLEQFCNLSHEATVLESTNHSLEKGACEIRAQLDDALEQTSGLRDKLEVAHTLNCEYEQQIEKLTQRIAQLECSKVCNNRVEHLERLLENARKQNIEARVKENDREAEICRLKCLITRVAGGGGGGGSVAPDSGGSCGAGETGTTLPEETKPPVPARRDPSLRLASSGTKAENADSSITPFSAPELSVYTANYTISSPDTSGERRKRSTSPIKRNATSETSPRLQKEHRNSF